MNRQIQIPFSTLEPRSCPACQDCQLFIPCIRLSTVSALHPENPLGKPIDATKQTLVCLKCQAEYDPNPKAMVVISVESQQPMPKIGKAN